MPRRHGAARERSSGPGAPRSFGGVAPEWAAAEGFRVHAVAGSAGRTYRCPGCQQEIRPGTSHLVVVADGDAEGRRHWHSPCWRQELRRLGRRK